LNRWVHVEPPGNSSIVLGVATETTADPGFRPSRQIRPPSAAYEIQQHEVTREELDRLIASRPELPAGLRDGAWLTVPAWLPKDAAARGKYPATGVPWGTAAAYCQAIGGSLPTEEQWEFAARGKELRPFPWGSAPLDLALTAAFRGKAATLGPVMSSNQDETPGGPEMALFDLAGNALEWTADLYRDDRPGQDERWVQEGGLTFRSVRGLPVADAVPKSVPANGAAYRQALCATGTCSADTAKTLHWVGFRCARPGQ
jgi:formylglycine-generating enzyme required for sulfatase activity